MLDYFIQNPMKLAIEEAIKARNAQEIPVGAVLVYNQQVVARSGNQTFGIPDPTAHAEIQVIRQAAQILKAARLNECDLYVTLEPCPMCAQAISFARIKKVFFGSYDFKGGGIDHGPKIFNHSTCHHKPEVYGGIMQAECEKILIRYFKNKRTLKKF